VDRCLSKDGGITSSCAAGPNVCGGFLHISAAGSQETIKKAKSIIKYAIIGFIVIFLAWSIIDSVLAMAGYIDPIGGEWHAINCQDGGWQIIARNLRLMN
jgi:hypothetical protein